MYKLGSTKIPEYLSQKRYKVVKNWECTEWPQTDLVHFTVISTLAGTKYLPLRSKFWSVSHYDYPFPRYKVIKNRKCTELPQTELEHLAVKTTLYALNTYPWGPNFRPFDLRSAVFKIQVHWKSEMHRMTPNWTWALNSQKYSIYT